MGQDTITLRLDGDVDLAHFAEAISGLKKLIESLQSDVAGESEINWIVEQLEVSSALATIRGTPRFRKHQASVQKVVKSYQDIGRACAAGMPLSYSPTVIENARKVFGVINGKIRSVVFETEEEVYEIRQAPRKKGDLYPGVKSALGEAASEARGAVVGRIQSVSNRGTLRFTMYESSSDKAVSCYLSPGAEEQIRIAWGKLATVEGIVRRSPSTGRPLSVRDVVSIDLIDDCEGGWLDAFGVSPLRQGEDLPEVRIRKIRDAW